MTLVKGDRIEVKFDGPGGWPWRPATVAETVPGLPGHARVVFDYPPTSHPSWWASPKNIRPMPAVRS